MVPPLPAKVKEVDWPIVACHVPGFTTAAAVAATSIENVARPGILFASIEVTVTELTPAAVGVPVMAPVEALIPNPPGRPAAVQEYGDFAPVAEIVLEKAVPMTAARVPGLVTVGAVPVVHVNDALPASREWSVAVNVTAYVPADVGVPEARPEVELILNPVGRPVAVHVYGVVPPDAAACNDAATLTAEYWAPGFVTVGPVAASAGGAPMNAASTVKMLNTARLIRRRDDRPRKPDSMGEGATSRASIITGLPQETIPTKLPICALREIQPIRLRNAPTVRAAS